MSSAPKPGPAPKPGSAHRPPSAQRSLPAHWAAEVLRHARQHGADRYELLAAAGVTHSALTAGDARLSPRECGRLLLAAARTVDDELLGGGRRPVPAGAFAMMCLTVVHTDDLGAAIRRAAEFYALFPGMPEICLTERQGLARVELGGRPRDGLPRFLDELLLVVLHRTASWLIGTRIRLHSVEFRFPPPPHRRELARLLGSRGRFECTRTAITFAADLLHAPVVQNETTLQRLRHGGAEALLGAGGDQATTADRVRELLHAQLRERLPSVEEIAARLALSPRTLRRRLQADGATLRTLREEARREAALASLHAGTEPLAELATRLGYSEPSAFHRAFKQWTGSTPGAHRPPHHPQP